MCFQKMQQQAEDVPVLNGELLELMSQRLDELKLR